MLDAAGVSYSAIPAHIDENAITAALSVEGHGARSIADALAEAKAVKIARSHAGYVVIGSDSTLSVGGRLFDKPASRDQAAEHLRLFSGQEMVLTSAIVAAEDGVPVWRHVAQARLSVRPLSEAFLETYLDHEWPAISGCVGCFRIEGIGAQLFDRMTGDYFTILGMPLLPLLAWLRTRGLMPS